MRHSEYSGFAQTNSMFPNVPVSLEQNIHGYFELAAFIPEKIIRYLINYQLRKINIFR